MPLQEHMRYHVVLSCKQVRRLSDVVPESQRESERSCSAWGFHFQPTKFKTEATEHSEQLL